MALTPEQIRRAKEKLRGMRAEAAQMTRELRTEIFRITETHRLRIQDAITLAMQSDGQITSAEIPRLSQTIRAETQAMIGEIDSALQQGNSAMHRAATQRAQSLATELDISAALFAPSPDVVLVASKFTADYISSVGADAVARINPILSRAALGGMSPFDAMKQITEDVIGIKGAAGVSYKAEMWVRTEVPKIYDTAFAAQIDIMQADMPNARALKKTWISGPYRKGRREEHQEMDGVTVPYDQPFTLPSGVQLDYPRAPGPDNAPGDVINCGCGWKIDADSMIQAMEE